MTKEEIINLAREISIKKVPTEKGFFDGRKRLETFILECLKHGYVGKIPDEEVEYYIRKFELDVN